MTRWRPTSATGNATPCTCSPAGAPATTRRWRARSTWCSAAPGGACRCRSTSSSACPDRETAVGLKTAVSQQGCMGGVCPPSVLAGGEGEQDGDGPEGDGGQEADGQVGDQAVPGLGAAGQ